MFWKLWAPTIHVCCSAVPDDPAALVLFALRFGSAGSLPSSSYNTGTSKAELHDCVLSAFQLTATSGMMMHDSILMLKQLLSMQVLLKWSLQSGFATIPKSTNPQRIIENIKVLELDLPTEQFDRLDSLSFQIRMLDGNFTTGENTPYPTIKELWDGEVPEENLKRRGLVAA